MNIERDKNYVNRTWKYLLPCLKTYGNAFKARFSSIMVLAVGIGDIHYSKNKDKDCLFLLVNKNVVPQQFKAFKDWIQGQEYFVDHYHYDDIVKGEKQMFVLRFPKEYTNAFKEFKEGNFSKMYEVEQLAELYYESLEEGREHHFCWIEAREVLTQSTKAIKTFIKTLKEEFGNDIGIKIKDLRGKELDFPPSFKKHTEIFNYDAINWKQIQ